MAAVLDGHLFFAGCTPLELECALWTSDGTLAGTQPVSEAGSSRPELLTVADGKLFFVVENSDLWVSDGTGPGTRLVERFDFPGPRALAVDAGARRMRPPS